MNKVLFFLILSFKQIKLFKIKIQPQCLRDKFKRTDYYLSFTHNFNVHRCVLHNDLSIHNIERDLFNKNNN